MNQRPADFLLRSIRKWAAGTSARDESDRELLDRFLTRRDQDAFATLVDRHGPMVIRLCRRVLRDTHAAEDAFQGTFLAFTRKAASIGKRELLAGWLYRVAYRVALEMRTRAGVACQPDLEAVADNARSPGETASARELCAVLDDEMNALPARYRDAFLLCHVEGQTRDQAARQLGVSVRTLQRRLEKGRELLQQRLSRRSVTLSGALVAAGLLETSAVAAMPALLAAATVRAAASLATGGPGALAGTTAQALALAEGVVKATAATRAAMVLIVVLGAALGGTGLMAYQSAATKPAAARPEEPAVRPRAVAAAPGPAEAAPPRADLHGDALPDGAVARLGTVRFNHGTGLNYLFFAQDGKTVISQGTGSIRLWSTASGNELRQFITPNPSLFGDQAVLSPDGTKLIISEQGWSTDTLRIWDLVLGREVRAVSLPAPRNEVSIYRRNAFSPDAQLCAVNAQEQIQVFEISTAKELYKLPKKGDKDKAVVFAGNDWLVTADQQQVISVWQARTGKPVRQIAHGSPVKVLIASPDGSRLATLEHYTDTIDRLREHDVINVWDLISGIRLHKLATRPKRSLTNARFSLDNKFLLTSTLRIKGNESDWKELNELTIWDMAAGKRIREVANVAGNAIAISPDGSCLAGGGRETFELWDLKNGQRLARKDEDGRHAAAATVLISPSGDRAFTIGYSSIRAWDATTGRRFQSCDLPLFAYRHHGSHSPDGRYASFAGDGDNSEILVWDLARGQRLHTLRPPGSVYQRASAFSPDSSMLATCSHSKGTIINIWDVGTGKEVRSFRETKAESPERLFFSADGKTLFVADGRSLVGLNAVTGEQRFSWRANENERRSWRRLSVSPNGTEVAFILGQRVLPGEPKEDRIVLCDARTGKAIRRWNDSGNFSLHSFEELTFSIDGRLLASSDRDAIHVWEVVTGKEILSFHGHRGEVTSLSFSANGRRLISASRDDTALIWDLALGLGSATPPVEKLGERDLAAAWTALAGEAVPAYAAVWRLADVPSLSVPFLRQRLRPVTEAQIRQLRQYIAALDDNAFAVREKAHRQLESQGLIAAVALRQALEKGVTLESRRRIEQLLDKQPNRPLAGESLQTLRALAVLEHADTPDARRLLGELAGGAVDTWLTEQAKASLERIGRRPGVSR